MKTDKYGYTEEEINKIISVITAMLDTAILLDEPIETRIRNLPGGMWTVHSPISDTGKEIKAFQYYAPINPFEFDLNCNHKMGFNSVEGMLRVYWRLTGNKFPGTEEFKGLYYLKNSPKASEGVYEQTCVYTEDGIRRSPINLDVYKEWFSNYIKTATF